MCNTNSMFHLIYFQPTQNVLLILGVTTIEHLVNPALVAGIR